MVMLAVYVVGFGYMCVDVLIYMCARGVFLCLTVCATYGRQSKRHIQHTLKKKP